MEKITKTVDLFDPHPGLLGCPSRLPTRVKLAIDELAGATCPLIEAIETLRHSTRGLPGVWTVEACEWPDGTHALAVKQRLEDESVNCWRALRYVDHREPR